MKTKFYLDGKKTTKKAMAEKIGKERLDRMVGEAKEGFFADPMEQQSFHLGSAEQTFPDNGHAIAWCIEQVAK